MVYLFCLYLFHHYSTKYYLSCQKFQEVCYIIILLTNPLQIFVLFLNRCWGYVKSWHFYCHLLSVPMWAIVLIAIGVLLILLVCCFCICKKCCKKRKKKEGKKGLKGAVDLKNVQLLGSTMKEKVCWFIAIMYPQISWPSDRSLSSSIREEHIWFFLF